MKTLPPELLRPIIEHLHLDLESLLSVSLASRELRLEGQRILFTQMFLPMDKEAQIQFLNVIISSSRLAGYVEEFQQLELMDPEVQPLWDLTRRGLAAMVNLKCLLFRARDGRPCAQILRGCTFQLEILRWWNYRDTEHLLEFLPSQPNLRILAVRSTFPEANSLDASSVCPKLQVLHGDQTAIDTFFPGRGITSLKWVANLEELRLDAPMYIPPQEFRRLRYLSYGGYFGRPLLNVILPHLPVLDVLELVDLHLIEELGWLAEIPMLRVFILSNSSYRDRGSVLSLEEREAYFPQLFESCTNLQHIDINTEGRAYQRWFRDGSAPSDIPDVDDVLLPEWHIS